MRGGASPAAASLEGWQLALAIVDSFYENVARHDAEGRPLREGEEPENLVLHFEPKPAKPMLVACLYARWGKPGAGELLSFAAITDEPPPEIAAAGHDRVIINLKPESVDTWLRPQGWSTAQLQAILADPERPFYEHEVMAA